MSGNGIASIDPVDGHLNWAQKSKEALGLPTVADEVVIVKDQHEQVLAFNRETGFVSTLLSPQPNQVLPRSFWPDPSVYQQSLVFPLRSGELMAISLKTLGIDSAATD